MVLGAHTPHSWVPPLPLLVSWFLYRFTWVSPKHKNTIRRILTSTCQESNEYLKMESKCEKGWNQQDHWETVIWGHRSPSQWCIHQSKLFLKSDYAITDIFYRRCDVCVIIVAPRGSKEDLLWRRNYGPADTVPSWTVSPKGYSSGQHYGKNIQSFHLSTQQHYDLEIKRSGSRDFSRKLFWYLLRSRIEK